MSDPYKVLGVNIGATDEDIRKAWLDKVKLFPPEHAPEQFRIMREAYEKIETRTKRYSYLLMSTDCNHECPFDVLIDRFKQNAARQPLPGDSFQKIIIKEFKNLYSQDETKAVK